MRTFLGWLWSGVCLLAVVLVYLSQTSPSEAKAKLAEWAKTVGVETPPDWLSNPGADTLVFVICLVVLVVSALIFWARIIRKPAQPIDSTTNLDEMTNTQLRKHTEGLAYRMREFQRTIEEERRSAFFDLMPSGEDRDEMERQGRELNRRAAEMSARAEHDFRQYLLPQAQALKAEVYSRLGLKRLRKTDNDGEFTIDRGSLCGTSPVAAAARFLEEIASRLPK
jgi:hypothetical protein